MYLDKMALWFGYIVIGEGILVVFILSLVLIAWLGNIAHHKLIEHYGGWKVFLKYREWYWKQQDDKVE